MPGCSSSSSGLGEPQAALAAGEERRRDLGEVALHRVEGLVEPALDRLGQLGAQLLELGEALLEILALRRELLEARLLASYSSFASGFTWPSDSRRRSRRSARSASSSRSSPSARSSVPACSSRRRASSASASMRATSTSIADTLADAFVSACRSSTSAAPSRRSSSPRCAGARPARVDVCAQRRLEPRSGVGCAGEHGVEPLRAGKHPRELMRTRAATAGPNRRVDACGFGGAGLHAELGCLGGGGVGLGDERAHLHAQRLGVAGLDRAGLAAEPHEIALGGCGAFGMGRNRDGAAPTRFSPSSRSDAPSSAVRSAPASPRVRSGASTTSTARSSASSARSSARRRGEQCLERADVGAADAQPRRGGCERRLGLLRLLVGACGGPLGEPRLLGERLRLGRERTRGAPRARAERPRRSRRRTRARRAAGRSRSPRASRREPSTAEAPTSRRPGSSSTSSRGSRPASTRREPRPAAAARSSSSSAAFAVGATSADARAPSAAATARSLPGSTVEQREREPLALLGERACCGRNALRARRATRSSVASRSCAVSARSASVSRSCAASRAAARA